MSRGKFIILEGMEFSGKTSCWSLLKEILNERKVDAIFTREPGGTEIGNEIRKILLTQENLTSDERALLFLTSRSIHCRSVIEPALANGTWVISDRYTPSNLVLQHESTELIKHISVSLDFHHPDYMLYVTCGYETTMQRMAKRIDNNVLDHEFTSRYKHFDKLYEDYVAQATHPTFRLDTNKDLAQLKVELCSFVDKILGE